MGETRGGKYGRNLAIWINGTISEFGGDSQYRTRFLDELRDYSFEFRKEGQPKNSGCVHELTDILDVDITCPEQFARLVKEGIHLMYQKNTSRRVFDSLLEYLEKE